jgi:3-dehydroquinate synthase
MTDTWTSLVFERNRPMRTTVLQGEGLLTSVRFWVDTVAPDLRSSHFLITDRLVNELYGDQVTAASGAAGVRLNRIVVEQGEQAKSLASYTAVCAEILDRGVDGGSLIVGLGGGVVANLAGFIASTLHRGIGLIQLPTTLLAQLDATIDFKQAINGPLGKNQIGSYYPPAVVAVDPLVLRTLDERQLASGMAEAVKHALTESPQLLAVIEDAIHAPDDLDLMSRLIEQTIALKVAGLNESQDHEYYEMIGQYGHAVAHALEHITDHQIIHGEAVAIGMCVTASAAMVAGVATEDVVHAHHLAVASTGLPSVVPATVDPNALWEVIRTDKHFRDGAARVGLVADVGRLCRGPDGWRFPLDRSLLVAAMMANRMREAAV